MKLPPPILPFALALITGAATAQAATTTAPSTNPATKPATQPTTSPTTSPATAPTPVTFSIGPGAPAATTQITLSPAPATLHVSALNLLVSPTDWLDEQYHWNFGDNPCAAQQAMDPTTGQPVDINTAMTGPVAGYLYESPGTYTVTLTRTLKTGQTLSYTATITVPAAKRTVYYISITGNDSNPGTDCQHPLKTIAAAMKHLADHTEFRFQRGCTFDVSAEIPLKHRDMLLDAYGDPNLPLPVIHHIAAPGVAIPAVHGFDTPAPYAGCIFSFWPGQTFDVTIRHLRFDSPFTTALTQGGYAYHAPVAYFGILRGRNVTVADCEFQNINAGPVGDQTLTGGFFLRDRQVDPLGIPARTLWLEGSDIVAVGNTGTNSTNESTFRAAATGIVRGSIAFNDIAQQLDASHDRSGAKAAATLRTLADVLVAHNRCTDGELSFDPHTADVQDNRVAVEGNVVIRSLLRVRPNVRHAIFRDNSITTQDGGGPCFAVAPGDGVTDWLEDVKIESNKGQGWQPNGRMFLIDNHPAAAMRNCDIDPAKNAYTKIAPPPPQAQKP